MNDRDFERLGEMLTQLVDSRLERIDAGFEQMDARFDRIDARFEQIDARFERIDARFEQLGNEFHHSMGLLRDEIERKIQLLSEGQQMLLEKVDRLEARVDNAEVSLGAKIDALAVQLTAHRLDPEAHQAVYHVRECGTEFGEHAVILENAAADPKSTI